MIEIRLLLFFSFFLIMLKSSELSNVVHELLVATDNVQVLEADENMHIKAWHMSVC